MALGPYRRLLAVPHVPALILAAILSRLPNGFSNLALVLIVSGSADSYAVAGVAVAVSAVAAAVSAPLFGRLIDRVGQTRVLVALGVGEAAAMLALAGASEAGAPSWVLVLLAAPLGFLNPPVSAALRALWNDTLPRDIAPDTAYSLESTSQELIFICGPLLAAAVLAVADAEAILVVGGVLSLVGTLIFASLPPSRRWRPQPHGGRGTGALSSGGVRTLIVLAGVLVVALSATEVTVVAFTTDRGSKGASGIVLALWAGASMVGGLLHGAMRWRRPVRTRLLIFASLMPLGFAPLLLADSIPQLAVAVVSGGFFIAPLLACVYTIVGQIAPQTAITEAFSWLNTAFVTGGAAGALIAGAVIEGAGTTGGFAVVVAAAAVGPLLVLARRGSLDRAPRDPHAAHPVPGN